MDQVTEPKGLFSLPAEIRHDVYRLCFGKDNKIEVTIGCRKLVKGLTLIEHPKTCRKTQTVPLHLLYVNKAISTEATAILQTIPWHLTVNNCSIEQLEATHSVINHALPAWLIPNITSLHINVCEFSLLEDALHNRGRLGRYHPWSRPDHCLMQSFPIAQMTSLRSCHFDIESDIESIEDTAHGASQQVHIMLCRARAVIGGRLSLNPPQIWQTCGEGVRDVDFTATVRGTITRDEQALCFIMSHWMLELRLVLAYEPLRAWIPVRRLTRYVGTDQWFVEDNFAAIEHEGSTQPMMHRSH